MKRFNVGDKIGLHVEGVITDEKTWRHRDGFDTGYWEVDTGNDTSWTVEFEDKDWKLIEPAWQDGDVAEFYEDGVRYIRYYIGGQWWTPVGCPAPWPTDEYMLIFRDGGPV